MSVQWSAVCENSVTHDGSVHYYGRVLGYVSNEEPPRYASRPVAGKKRWVDAVEDPSLISDIVLTSDQLPHPDAVLAGTHELPSNQRRTIVGARFMREVDDVDPTWDSLATAGIISNDPVDVVLSNEVQAAIDAEEAASVRPNWSQFANAGALLPAYTKLLAYSTPNFFTALMAQLTSLRNEQRFLTSFNLCKDSLPTEHALTTEELAGIDALLAECNFTIRVS